MTKYKYGYSDTPDEAAGEAGLMNLVKNTVSDALKATGTMANEAVAVTMDALTRTMAAIQETGGDLLEGTQSIAKRIIIGVSRAGEDVLSAASQTARNAVHGAADVGADVASVAKRTVEGIIEATREIGGNVEEVTKAAVGGAIDAAGSIGEEAVNAVKTVLQCVAEGEKSMTKYKYGYSDTSDETIAEAGDDQQSKGHKAS